MNDEPDADDDPRYSQAPADFPRPVNFANDRYHPPECAPREIFDRWDVCEYLAQQFCEKSLGTKASNRAHMSEVAILDQFLERLLKSGWGSDAEMRWVIRRAAELAHWPAPEPRWNPAGNGQSGAARPRNAIAARRVDISAGFDGDFQHSVVA